MDPQEHHDRLDGEGERPSQNEGHGQAHPAQVRLPARQARISHTNRAQTGRVALREMGCIDEHCTCTDASAEAA